MEIWENLSLEDMEGEIWRDVVGYEGLYQVSNMGRIKSLNYGKTKKPGILKQKPNCWGYLTTCLAKNSIPKTKSIHRLVAMAFVKNPLNKKTVDHINTVVTDNRACNLRWLSQKEQFYVNEITKERHRESCVRNGKIAGKKYQRVMADSLKKKVRCITTGEIFPSCSEASEFYNLCKADVSRCCRGIRKTCGGKQWEYID